MIVVVRYGAGIQPRMVVIVSYDALHEAVALTHPLFSIGPPAFQIVLACSRAFSALYHDVVQCVDEHILVVVATCQATIS